MFGWFRELHGDGNWVHDGESAARCQLGVDRESSPLAPGPGLTKGEFWLLVISGSAGIRALHHEGSVIASSVMRRLCGGLVKGCSVGKTWYKGHRKEGTLVFR